MLRSDAARDAGASSERRRLWLYLEGPRDRDILRVWVRRFCPTLARTMEPATVILGGRQPARAVAHFRRQGGARAGLRAVCVLDRDDHASRLAGSVEPPLAESEVGLEFFTWGRRHIESYLLVPDAIQRWIQRYGDGTRADRAIRELLPDPGDETALREIDAKRLLASRGPLARLLGRPLSPGGIARSMSVGELHADVLSLFEHLRAAAGLPLAPEVVVRR